MLIPMVAADIAKWIAFGTCKVHRIHGFNNQSTDLYIQLHELSQGTVSASQVQPTNGTVPNFKSLFAQSQNGFNWELGPEGVTFSELVICISTTEANLTLVGVAAGLDMTIDVESQYLVNAFPTLTVVGDLTNDVTILQVWAEAAGPKQLRRVDSRQGATGVVYVAGYAVDTPLATSKLQTIEQVTGNSIAAPTKGNAGSGGIFPLEKTPADQALHQGFTLQPQLVSIPAVNDGSSVAKIRAIYV